jgi:hypothetical protein
VERAEVLVDPRTGLPFARRRLLREKAEDSRLSGALMRILLLPERFGGQDIATNVVYVPVWVAKQKSSIDENVIAPLVADGKVHSLRSDSPIRR